MPTPWSSGGIHPATGDRTPSPGIRGFASEPESSKKHAWHRNTTWSTNCYSYVSRWHHQYEQFYKQRLTSASAEFCFDNGWHQSRSASSQYQEFWAWDAGHWCNYGGVHMKLFIDTWQGAWNGAAWIDGSKRPATAHCHCP